jgi:hypothetical protein
MWLAVGGRVVLHLISRSHAADFCCSTVTKDNAAAAGVQRLDQLQGVAGAACMPYRAGKSNSGLMLFRLLFCLASCMFGRQMAGWHVPGIHDLTMHA